MHPTEVPASKSNIVVNIYSGLRRAGLRAINHDELSRYFDCALGAGSGTVLPAQAIIGFDAVSLSNATTLHGTMNSAMFCHIRNSAPPAAEGLSTSVAAGAMSFAKSMANNDLHSATEIVFAAIKNHLTKLISVPADRIDLSTSILSLGVDSLISIELRNWIVRQFEAPMQSSEILIDQTIRGLSEKVVSRSRIASGGPSPEESENDASLSTAGLSSVTAPSSQKLTCSESNEESQEFQKSNTELPSLPHPELEATLSLFQESRRAIDPPEVLSSMADAVGHFLKGPGPALQQRLETLERNDDFVAKAYERYVYLDRREPLQDFSQYSVGHSLKAPSHSQATRATILTISAMQFAHQIASGALAPDVLHGAPINAEARSWMFYATRRPCRDVDTMERHPPNQSVAVMRRGHIFQLLLPGPAEVLLPAAVFAAYEAIIKESEHIRPSISSLTSDHRRSWAMMRSKLELHPENAASLEAMDNCAFVVCLDDESPLTAGERHVQFLLSGLNRPLSNRWQDKPLQLAITANGLSAGIFEHTKLDGMDVRSLTRHLTRSLFSLQIPDSKVAPYPVQRLEWKLEKPIIQQINQFQLAGTKYKFIDHCYIHAESLGLRFLTQQRAPPHATVHLTVLLAMHLVDGYLRPAWEIASVARFFRGRIDWVQTVTIPIRAFIEAAAAWATKSPSSIEAKDDLRALFNAATTEHTSLMSSAANGLGYVSYMYSLLAAYEDTNKSSNAHHQEVLPDLFCSPAWNSTRRGGPGQDLKIGFMPAEYGDTDEWEEGGFLMEGEHGVYIHCSVQEQRTKFAISARTNYASEVCTALIKASEAIYALLI